MLQLHGLRPDHVLTAQAGNGARTAWPCCRCAAKFPRHVRVTRSVAGRPINLSVSPTLRSEQDVEKGGLPKFDGKSLLQGVIKNRVSGGIGEIGQDNRVLLGQCALRSASVNTSPRQPERRSGTRAAGTRIFQSLPLSGTVASTAFAADWDEATAAEPDPCDGD